MDHNQFNQLPPNPPDPGSASNPAESALEEKNAPTEAFPIVGIGASAGGLAAFERFFTHLPPDTGMAFVVVQHLGPPRKSILPEILQRYTSMKVVQVTDGIEVEPNVVYVIPPSNNLALTDGHLILLKPPTERGYRFPIDFFFRSLAEARKDRAVGVVLSGTASDGSLGVKNIKAEGGLTIAQEPGTADFGDMPRNAIATHDIDYVLPPEKMGELIVKFVSHQVQLENRDSEYLASTAVGSLQKLYYLLRSKTGHDFSLYKQNTLLRRIDRRIKITLVPNLDVYIKYLQQHPEEISMLFHEMLINVTQFFRDPGAFTALAAKAIRPLVLLKGASQAPIRVWAPGCSTGEEAYSLAILLQEQIEQSNADCKVQIYATDLDTDAIITARRGSYADGALENVSQERLKRFFTKEEDGYHIKKAIRDMVVFSNQNLVFDPPFSKIDLLCCRNVLIYLQPELQKQLFPLFHYALAAGGFLFLGNSESIGAFNNLFNTIDRKHKIYQRKDVVSQHRIYTQIQPTVNKRFQPDEDIGLKRTPPGGLREWVDRELLKYHMPACVIIDEKNNVLYIHGRSGKYLEPAPGEANANLLRMAREGLKGELATAIRASTAANKTVSRPGIRVKTNGDYQTIVLTVRPVEWNEGEPGMSMVIFEDMFEVPASTLAAPMDLATRDQVMADLENALKEKDEYLNSIINELEDANQELKSINEELLSSNEEMQSSNEELETSREELQSINEELSTVNAELQNKNAELTMLNNDVYNLLASTEIGTIFLDLDLHLRRFTPAIQQIYSFLPGDVGRPLSHFHSNLDYDSLVDDILQVLSTLSPKAIEAQTKDGVWYLVNIQPYRTLENIVDGAVITFVDITRQKQRDEQSRLDTLLRDANDAITVQDFFGNIQAWNQSAVQTYGWTEAEALKMNVRDLLPEELLESTLAVYRRLRSGKTVRPFESKRLTRGGRVLDVWVTLSVLYDYTQEPVGVSTVERDITEQKQATQTLRFENRSLKALSDLLAREPEATLVPAQFHDICRLLARKDGYRLAWIGLTEPGQHASGRLSNLAGIEEGSAIPAGQLDVLARLSQDLAAQALNGGRPVALRAILSGAAKETWNDQALEHAFNAVLVLPLAREGKPVGVLAVYAGEPEAFIDTEIENLRVFSNRIAVRLQYPPAADT